MKKASKAVRSAVVPGLAYKLVNPFLRMEITFKAWKIPCKRN